jgi:hypothetical protein
MMKRMLLSCLAFALLVGSVPSFAHHPLTEYNENETQTLEGTLVDLVFKNPHSLMSLDVTGANGAIERWTIEWFGALPLKKQGVLDTTLGRGDRLVVTGHPAKSRQDRRLWLRTITRPADRWTWTGSF